MDDLLTSPVLKRVLCNPGDQFSFKPNSVILAKIDRAELGEFDALVLGLLLMAHYKGQVIVSDFGFYGRDAHVSLIREGRLIAGVNFLDELPDKLRHMAEVKGISAPLGCKAMAFNADAVSLLKLLNVGTQVRGPAGNSGKPYVSLMIAKPPSESEAFEADDGGSQLFGDSVMAENGTLIAEGSFAGEFGAVFTGSWNCHGVIYHGP